MTKDQFLTRITLLIRETVSSQFIQDYIDLCNEFFESNVCIPKGDNRHPYADVLHKIAEGAQGQRKLYSNISPWEDYEFTCDEYRIKPSEPIYKYQFAYLPMGSAQYEISEHMTEEEAGERFRLMPCEKIDATKKEYK